MAKLPFIDDEYIHIENEFDQIQQCPGMYISSKGTAGALHLIKELTNNSIDECTNIYSPCNKIDIYFYEDLQHFIIEDNGRGIPFDKMVEVCTAKHTSTKYNRGNNVYSAGCNGVGIKVTIAFAKLFSIESYRGNESKLVSFADCKMTDNPVEKNKKERHGLITNFIPSQEQLGDVKITCDDIIEWLRHMSYTLPDKLVINFYAMRLTDDGKPDIIYDRQFIHAGLEANVKFLTTKLEFDPITIGWAESEEPGSLRMELSFSYDKTIEEEAINSYCNYVWTFGDGYHVNTCRSVLCDFMVRAARTADPVSKYPVVAADVRKGLAMAVDCKWAAVILGGQHKSTVESEEIDDMSRKGLFSAFNDFFAVNNGLLNKLIAYYRQMSKIRLEAYKIKGIKPPKALSMYDEADIQGFFPLTDSSKKGYKELIITEGESAAGAIVGARNPQFQAIYHTQGVMKNTAEITLGELNKSRIPRDLCRILGVEPGANFDINNLKYDKIIFLQDADADGKNIRSLASAFLIVWTPQLVEEGRLYAGVPPLYTLSEKTQKKFSINKNFMFDKHEYRRLFDDIIAKNIEFYTVDSDEETPVKLNKGEIKAWLDMNKDYSKKLDTLATTNEACHPKIIEFVCNAIIRYGIGSKQMIAYLKSVLPEMIYDETNKSLCGSYNTEHYGIIIDDVFMDFAAAFIDIMSANSSMWVIYSNKNDQNPQSFKVSIGEFFDDILGRYNIDVTQRFKGLGEAKPQLLFLTTLNPKIRKLIRLTMEDRERVLAAVKNLHGEKFAAFRRELLAKTEITDDDIDN